MTPEIIKWLLSFSADVLVIEPKKLMRATIEHATGMLQGYAKQEEGEEVMKVEFMPI